jgi:phosphoribosylamine--glycine ligase
MKVLVIGQGGREHALAWKLAQCAKVSRVYVAPGNAGTAHEPHLQNVPITSCEELIAWVQAQKIDLTVVGPEMPLAQGWVDAFQAHHLRIFGPRQRAAQLESSKAFAKDFMQRHRIPTADSATFDSASDAHTYIDQQGAPIVIKADGLAAGKGVVVAMTLAEAHAAVEAIFATPAGARVVIEAFLEGEEASFIVLCDGKNVLPLATSQDHKRLGDGDKGPNTGGMGAYSPAPVVTPEIHAKVMREIILPTVHGLAQEGMPYTGFLYAGLMVMPTGEVKTLEFNCRLGDPETQPLLMRLQSDLFDLLWAATEQQLDQQTAQWDRRPALGVVLAAQGYPENPLTGTPITALPKPHDHLHIFHAGTQEVNGVLQTSGGRVLCVTVLGENLVQARQLVYEAIGEVTFAGMQFRQDIGLRGLSR